jgi:RNA polymerase sigma-70 factor, ECF subfamily
MGLLALILCPHSRREARRDAQGRYVPLSDQAVERWDQPAIDEAEGLLQAAGALGAPGRFQLEAAVQSVHAARRLTGTTDWEAIAVLYDALFALTASPVVAVNRAAAVARARGAAAGLKLLDEVEAKGGLAGFEPYWVARADLCAKLGEVDAARSAYGLAIGLQTDPAARAFLIERLAALV